MAEKSYRIRTNVGRDKVIKASLTQDINFLEILSLKINQEDTYKLHVSNYGIIVGRVLGNEAFGIPNARVSVFIKLSDEDKERSEIVNIYPYRTIMTKDKENRRYNLLADSGNDDCHRIVGTFPNKRLVLDNETEIEIYEKYWKYTTVTNQSGDYMIFGVPTGNHTIHVDIDLSDIGILSQKPRDFFYKGYNKEQFDSSEQFKSGKNLDNLTQLLTQNTSVHVYPFFGDSDINDIAITRCDIEIPYKFEPTCVFFGSIISDRQGEHIQHKCGPSRWIGYNRNMVTGEGTIEMIRKTPDGLVEEFPIKGNHLIDGDGVWCYQIPMNLDYIGTDEFGNIIPVQDSTKGIPTRTSVRFRISMQETVTQTSTEHVAKYLVPNVHDLNPDSNYPQILVGKSYQSCYEFGSATPNEFFRDLLWNKVYSVKNYIPRFEHRNWFERVFDTGDRGYSGIRSVSSPHNNNVFPFNNARFHLKFTYRVLCILMTIVVKIISFYNRAMSELICWELSFKVFKWKVSLGQPLKFLSNVIKCIGLKGELFFAERADTYYFPSCKDCANITDDEGLKVNSNTDDLLDLIQQTLALEYEIVNLDFYNDWINGALYMPLWFWKKRAKKKYFFGLFTRKGINAFCSCDKQYENLSLSQSCSTTYDANYMPLDALSNNEFRHKDFDRRSLKFGVIKEFTNRAGLNVYYYAPGVPYDLNYHTNEGATNYTQLFATDIILLGSLNNCDLDNLPKTFDSLPSTTVNVPFIATLSGEESGDGVVTGLDWGHDGVTANGLLLDLTCWNIYTKYKSCVNLQRLSELYVSMDMDITSEDDSEESIVHDGIIGNDEIMENETRAKFASMNHNGLSILTKNPTTNYDTYKFHYIYPINFDGHLNGTSTVMNRKSGGVRVVDNRDSNYVMYRLGEGKDSKSKIRHKKHFYNGSETKFNFPLYNNSFYFYFGLKEGKTAIDKFNSMFNASCANQNKYGFVIKYVSKPGKWCYDTNNIRTDFGTIDIEFEGLTDTFSYSLFNEFNELLINETDVQSENLRFGYEIKEGGGAYLSTNDGYVRNGRLCYFKDGAEVRNVFEEPIYLENGVYYLEVINAFGLKVTQRINMVQNTLSPNIEVAKLGTKFNSSISQREDICGNMDYYGEIRINSFIIDGEEAFITNITEYFIDGENNDDINKQPKELTCKVTCTDGSEIYLILEQEGDEKQNIGNFVCYGEGQVPSTRLELLGDGIYTLIFNIWKPGDYVLTSNQICQNVMNDNVSVNTISVENGEKFQILLNGVPINFINNEYFKGSGDISGDTDSNTFLPQRRVSKDEFPRVWLQLENPKIYKFPLMQFNNIGAWEDYLDIISEKKVDENGNVNEFISRESKINILRFQIETIAKVRDISYIYGESNIPLITFTSIGGKEPILMRNIHPNYAEIEDNNNVCKKIIVENNNFIEAPLKYPHIIDRRYQGVQDWNPDGPGIRLNDTIYSNIISQENGKKILGNYFAAFTNNGGMVTLQDGRVQYDSNLYSESIPNNANALLGYNVNNPLVMSSYPSVVKDNYLRTLFVDKRLLIVGDMFQPIKCDYEIYQNDDGEWKKGRWNAEIYNAAPMIYDNEYNIIGDDLSYEIKVKGSGETKYYTYNRDEDGMTYYFGDTDTYFKGKKMGQLIARGYEFEDAVNYFKSCILNLYDNVITNLTINSAITSSGCAWEVSYDNLDRINSTNAFESDADIRLVSNLMWYSDMGEIKDNKAMARNKNYLYKCMMDIDGEEIDQRSEFYVKSYSSMSSETLSQNAYVSVLKPHKYGGIELKNGNTLTFTMANAKMKGNLDYSNKTENEDKYEFKSYIEGADETVVKYDIGEKIDIMSGALLYGATKTGYYIMWNGERFYLNERKYDKYYTFIEDLKLVAAINIFGDFLGNSIDENYKNYVIEKGGITGRFTNFDYETLLLTATIKDFDENGNIVFQEVLSGFLWVRRQCLNMELSYLKDLAKNESMQNILNKYGINYYTCIWNNTLYYTFNPIKWDNDKKVDNIKFSGLTTIEQVNNYVDYYYHVTDEGIILILTYDEISWSNGGTKQCREKNGYFYIPHNVETNTIMLPTLCTKNDNNLTFNIVQSYNLDVPSSDITITLYYYLAKNPNDEIYKKECAYLELYDGETVKAIDDEGKFYNCRVEKNPLNDEWYWFDDDKKTSGKFYKLFKLSKDGEEDKYYSVGGEIKDGDSVTNISYSNVAYENNILTVISTSSISADTEFFLEHPLINDKVWVDINYTCVINYSERTVTINNEIFNLHNSLYNKYEIQHIDDFSCSVRKDISNDNYDHIEASVPFLSSSVICNYELPLTQQTVSGELGTALTVPSWTMINTQDVVITGGSENVIFFQSKNICLARHQYYSASRNGNKGISTLLPINNIQLQTIGDYTFCKGEYKIRNIFQENNDSSTYQYYTNCNVLKNSFLFSTEGDKGLDSKYRTVTPIVGEMLPYLRRNVIDDLVEEGEERTTYFAKGVTGKGYGNYTQLPVKGWFRNDYYYYYQINEEKNGGWTQVITSTPDRIGIGIQETFVQDYNRRTMEEVTESYDLYDDIIYVYQPNTRENILKGTEIISCNLVKTYYNSNLDFRFQITPTLNQSCNFHVGSMYFGNVQKNGKYDGKTVYNIPLYFPKYSNQDIKKMLTSDTIKCYFNNIEVKLEQANNYTLKGDLITLYSNIEEEEGKYILKNENKVGFVKDISTVSAYMQDSQKNSINVRIDGKEQNAYLISTNSSNIYYQTKNVQKNIKFGIRLKENVALSSITGSDFTFQCVFGKIPVMKNKKWYYYKNTFSATTSSNTLTHFSIYNAVTADNTFIFKLDAEENIQNAPLRLMNCKSESHLIPSFNFSTVNDDKYSLVNPSESGFVEPTPRKYVTYKVNKIDKIFYINDGKVTINGETYDVITENGKEVVKTGKKEVVIEDSTIVVDSNNQFEFNIGYKLSNGSVVSSTTTYKTFTINSDDTVILYCVTLSKSFKDNASYLPKYVWFDENNEINFPNETKYTLDDIRDSKLAMDVVSENIIVGDEFQDAALTKNIVKKYERGGTYYVKYNNKEQELTKNADGSYNLNGKMIFNIKNEVTAYTGTVKEEVLEVITEQQSYIAITEAKTYTPFSNIWKNNAGKLSPFSSATLNELQKNYNSGMSVSGFMKNVISAMCDDYNSKTENANKKINMDDLNDIHNIGNIWKTLNNEKNGYMITSNKYLMTIKLDRRFCYFNNNLYFEDDSGNIKINGTEYEITYDEFYGYYLEKANGIHDIQVHEFITIIDIQCGKNTDEIKGCLEVVAYNNLNNTSMLVQESFDVDYFLYNVFFIKTKENGGNVYQITNNGNAINYRLNDKNSFKNELFDLTKGDEIKLYDIRTHKNNFVKVNKVEDGEITYESPFDSSQNIKCKLKDVIKYDETNIFANINRNISSVKVDDYIALDIYISLFDNSKMIEIECYDGYVFVGLSTEDLTILTQDGTKETKLFMELLNTSVQSQYIYHMKKIDDVWYEFASQIKNIREISSDYVITFKDDNTVEKHYVLSIEVNNMVHKFPFIYDTNSSNFKPL